MNKLINSIKAKVFFTFICCLGFFNAFAQPANDEPCSATALTIGATCSYLATDNVGATSSAGIQAPGCAGTPNNDVWFSVVVPSNGNVNVNSLLGTMTYAGMAFYTGSSCSGLTLLKCDTYSSNNSSDPMISSSGLIPGSILYIRFWQWGGGSGTFSICATAFTVPTNNEPSSALMMTSSPTCTAINSSVFGATQSLVGCVGNANDDVWFSFVATATSQLIGITPVTGFDPIVELFSGTPGSLTSIKCDDSSYPSGTNGNALFSGLTIGQTYYYRVYQYSSYFPNTANSSFTTCLIDIPSPPSNDLCSTASLLTVNSSCVSTTGSIYGATASSSVTGCGSTTNVYDVWFKFVATNEYQNITATLSNNASLRLQVFSGFSCNNLTSIFCGQLTSTSTFATIDELVPGETYYYRIFPSSSFYPASNLTYSTCVTIPAPATNQDCIKAIPLCNNVYSTTTAYSSFGSYNNEINTSLGCLASGEKNDVWYTFTVINSGTLNFSITPVNLADDYDWAVYNLTNASCTDINDDASLQVACNYSPMSGVTGPNGLTGNQNSPTINVVAGQTFMVNVSQYSLSNAGYTIDFSGSLATIFDNVAPTLDTAYVTCNGELSTTFSENVICSNVSVSDFTVSGPDGIHTVTSVYSDGCANGGSMDNTYVLTLSPAITVVGSYTLNLVAGAGSATDLCGNVAAAQSLNINYSANPYYVSASTTQNVLCYGGNTGHVTCTPSGGTAPYTYNWFSTANHNASSQTVNDAYAGTYTVILTDANGCIDTASTVVTQPADLITTILPQTAQCLTGNSFNFSATTTAVTPTYSWNFGDASPLNTTSAPTHVYAASGDYNVTLVVQTTNCSDTARLAITVNPTTQITSPVIPTQTVCSGVAFTPLSVVANGANLTYQWYSNTTNINSGGTLISGATNSSYTPSSSVIGTMYYYCVVSGTCGTVTSSISGAMIVNPNTSITSQSTNGQSICFGDAFTSIGLTSNGTGLSYQWYSNSSNSTIEGTLIASATNSSYLPSSASVDTTYYYCVVSGTCGSDTTSLSGAMIVKPLTSISSQSTATQTICEGSSFNSINVVANGLNPTYQWYSSATNLTAGGILILGATASSYTPSATGIDSLYYYCVISGTCGSDTSLISGLMVVNPTTSITSSTLATQTVCSGSSFTALTVLVSGSGLTYQWYSNTLSSNIGGTIIAGATNSAYTPLSSSIGTTYYYCVVSGDCGSDTTLISEAQNVVANLSITSQSTPGQVICEGSVFTPISVSTNINNATYQWYSNTSTSTVGDTIVTGATSATYTPNSIAVGSVYYYCVASSTCGSDTSSISGVLTVSSIPASPVLGSDVTYCNGKQITSITLPALTNGNYTWYADQALTDTISSSSVFIPMNATATYYVTSTNTDGCTSASSVITITVENCEVFIPTAITPNNDGNDDLWILENIDASYPNNQVTVFNRWGEKLFQSSKGDYESAPWNGKMGEKDLPIGSYFFIIEYNNDSNEIKKGTISILKK